MTSAGYAAAETLRRQPRADTTVGPMSQRDSGILAKCRRSVPRSPIPEQLLPSRPASAPSPETT